MTPVRATFPPLRTLRINFIDEFGLTAKVSPVRDGLAGLIRYFSKLSEGFGINDGSFVHATLDHGDFIEDGTPSSVRVAIFEKDVAVGLPTLP
jgi:hypothetical protein